MPADPGLVLPAPVAALFDSLASTDISACVLDPDLRVVATNAAWDRFARENGGEALVAASPPLGRSLLDAISGGLRTFYAAGFHRARVGGAPWQHDYECSSPETFRVFRMTAYPIDGWIVVTHALRVAHPHDVAPRPPDHAYRHGGVVRMCGHCRRVRHPDGDDRWDWVPAYVATVPPMTSHGLCPPCAEYYFPTPPG